MPPPLSQGLLTFGYLVLLSRIGERMAVDMRRALFSNLLRYCQLQSVGRGNQWTPGVLVNVWSCGLILK